MKTRIILYILIGIGTYLISPFLEKNLSYVIIWVALLSVDALILDNKVYKLETEIKKLKKNDENKTK